MKIVEYDRADPLGVLHRNLLSLGYVLAPERVALGRQLDQRPFPFFALYALEDETVAGQVGVYRLPMVTIDGPEDVGGICAMCTRPGFARRGLASRLMDEAHVYMRSAGLRFSTPGTARYRVFNSSTSRIRNSLRPARNIRPPRERFASNRFTR